MKLPEDILDFEDWARESIHIVANANNELQKRVVALEHWDDADDSEGYKRGYREGFADGWRAAQTIP